MAETILRQTLIMLILILIGAISCKVGIISKESNKHLSRFVLEVVNPAVIFMSYQTELKAELVRNLLLTFVLSAAAIGIMAAAAYLLIRPKPERKTEIERFSSIYSNCGFMGIPLVNALFGMEGVFYLTAFITVFNLAVWTHGVLLITGEKDVKSVLKVLRSPTMIAIGLGLLAFFLRLRLPEIPAKALGYIADLNTPLAMVVSGVTISETSLLSIVKQSGVYRVCCLKLILLPFILSVISVFIPVAPEVKLTVLVAAAAPPAAMCTLLCIRCGKDSVYSSEIFTAGTILSVISLPLVIEFTEFLTKMIS